MCRIAILIISALLGTLAALHPFASTDPAIDPIDKIICPFYVLTPLIPVLSEGVFVAVAVVSNLLLYSLIAWVVTVMIGRAAADL